jgi:peptidoglycan/LPS O-acetylase OafA/YrhL
MFFMITGFLFWGKMLSKTGEPDWLKLYVDRVFRIGPLYLFGASILIIGALVLSGGRLREPPGRVGVEIVRWLALGATTGGAVNGFTKTGDLIANVTWTLRYEWVFYASLVVTALFARRRLTSWAFPAVGFVVAMAVLIIRELSGQSPAPYAFLALFFAGMFTAAAKPWVLQIDFAKPIWSAGAAALILAVLLLFSTAYAAAPIALLGAAFFLIASGASLFGLLNTRAARRLGDISFGIYLLQGAILAGAFATPAQRTFASASGLNHWLLISIAGVALIGVATASHILIERPGVRLGHAFLAACRGGMVKTERRFRDA